jgi:hypothetical protein
MQAGGFYGGPREVPLPLRLSHRGRVRYDWEKFEGKVCNGLLKSMGPVIRDTFFYGAGGVDLKPHYRRYMSILEKVKEQPGITVKEIPGKYSKFEREEIYPPIYDLNVNLMPDEMAAVDYIEWRGNKVYPKNPPDAVE